VARPDRVNAPGAFDWPLTVAMRLAVALLLTVFS
jgi:hypothetical protein